MHVKMKINEELKEIQARAKLKCRHIHCRKTIDKNDYKCPHCGYRVKYTAKEAKEAIAIIAIAIVLAAAYLNDFWISDLKPSSSSHVNVIVHDDDDDDEESLSNSQRKELTLVSVCKATIATLFGKNPITINIDTVKNGIVNLSYIRKNDSKRWGYRCKVKGNSVIWASETGRWRTHRLDPKIIYKKNGENIMIEEKYSDGSKTIETYNMGNL